MNVEKPCSSSPHKSNLAAEAQAKRRREDKRRRDKFRLNPYQGTETKEQRETRLKKQRERSQKNRAKKTEIEKKLQREEKNRKLKEKRLNESSNQKFWRLMWRRTYRRIDCPYKSVEFEYHRSTHQPRGINQNFGQGWMTIRP